MCYRVLHEQKIVNKSVVNLGQVYSQGSDCVDFVKGKFSAVYQT